MSQPGNSSVQLLRPDRQNGFLLISSLCPTGLTAGKLIIFSSFPRPFLHQEKQPTLTDLHCFLFPCLLLPLLRSPYTTKMDAKATSKVCTMQFFKTFWKLDGILIIPVSGNSKIKVSFIQGERFILQPTHLTYCPTIIALVKPAHRPVPAEYPERVIRNLDSACLQQLTCGYNLYFL